MLPRRRDLHSYNIVDDCLINQLWLFLFLSEVGVGEISVLVLVRLQLILIISTIEKSLQRKITYEE